MPTIAAHVLYEFATSLLAAGGASASEADVVADSLVQANLRGHDSHGVMRIPFYVQNVREKVIHPGVGLKVSQETNAALVCDGGWGFGQVLCRDLVQRLIAKAKVTGVACGSIQQASHIGRLGEYGEIAAAEKMCAIICANTHGSGKRVAPIGGKRPRLGTNPISIAIPGGKDGPFVLDFSTSAVAEGKVRVKKIAGQSVPDGWILDSEGRPTNDPNQLYADPPGSILPMGGMQGGYKGFGLAYMIEMLCGCLSGGLCSFPEAPPPRGNSALFIVISPERMAGIDHLARQAKILEEYVRDVPLADGVSEVTLPGDPERRVMKDRQANGIPLDDGNWAALVKLAGELGVAVP